MCSKGTDWVWNDELNATCGQNVSTAHWMICCGVFVSNSWESFSISSLESTRRLYRYNRGMDAGTALRLSQINQEFYTRFGDAFSATRHRIQPGVRRVLDRLNGGESILDLGCGNAELARELAKRGHRGPYLGLDFSAPLLRDAEPQPEGFSAGFIEADLTQLAEYSDQLSIPGGWSMITAFAVLHHIPSHEMRLRILQTIHGLLAEDGKFVLSNWKFLNSEKLRGRIQEWSEVGLSEGQVDPGDYLLDWRSGGDGLRYVHHFREEELTSLAKAAGFA
ncbi:MAG: class I SAM-dependent methyltransferase, partial [Syntrophothermus sp.]